VTGADAMTEIFHWKDPEEVLALAHFIAATRPGYDLTRFLEEAPTRNPNVSVMNIPALAISSTDIRERVRDGRPIRYLVPEGVKSYIEKAGLYR
jgi:nicotinate-nucleotide adenylyltransferase